MWKHLLVLFLLVITAASFAPAQEAQPRPEVPYVPTPPEVVEQMLKMANVGKDDFVIDLGSGDGRIVIMAAQKFGAHGIGVDINPERIAEARENAKKAGVEKMVEFKQGDIYKADIKKATVVTMYLLPSVNMKIRDKLLTELKPGTRLVSHAFDMGEWKPEKTAEVEYRRIYYWTVPPEKPHFSDTPTQTQ